MIFEAITFCHSVSGLEQLAIALTHFPISQPSNGMRCQAISEQVTLQSSRGTFRALTSFRRFLLIYTFVSAIY